MLLRERVGDELPGEAGARALAAVGLAMRATPILATSQAESASGWPSRS